MPSSPDLPPSPNPGRAADLPPTDAVGLTEVVAYDAGRLPPDAAARVAAALADPDHPVHAEMDALGQFARDRDEADRKARREGAKQHRATKSRQSDHHQPSDEWRQLVKFLRDKCRDGQLTSTERDAVLAAGLLTSLSPDGGTLQLSRRGLDAMIATLSQVQPEFLAEAKNLRASHARD